MGFNSVVSAPQQTIINAGAYQGRDYLCATPLVVVMRARPSVTSAADVLFNIPFDTVTVGDYLDIREDMVVLITSGTTLNHLKRPLFRGRVTKLPTSSILYIGEASIALDPSLYITVIEQRDVGQRLRSFNLIDGHLVPETLAPAIMGLQSSYFQEPDAITGEASFVLSPVGQAMEEDDSITDATAWEWEFSGAVTYDVGSATDREIEISVPTGHVWGTVKCTGDLGVVGSFVFEIYVQDRYDSDMIFLGNEGADISNNWNEGVNASVNYFAGVEDILDRTRCTIVTFEKGRGGDAEFPNISFVGYLRNDDNQSNADEQYSLLKTRSYQISGFAALMGEVKLSHFAVRDIDPPVLWDDMILPNAARLIAHMTNRYSTLARLCCIDYSGILSNDWYGGNMDIESAFLLDACNQTAEELDAQLIFAADGQITIRRNLNMIGSILDTTERDAADVIATIPTSRMTLLSYSHPHMPNLAQLQVGFRSYRTADGSSIGLTATAPAVALAEGADFDEIPGRLLTADATIGEARTEAAQLAGNLLAYRDDGDEWEFELDGWYRFAQPSQHQWWKAPVAASEISNGLGLTSSDRLLLKSISHKFEPERGTRQLTATFKRETIGGLAMILVEVIPDVVPTVMQPRPPLPAYQGAFNPSGTLNYTSQTPAQLPPSGYAYVSMPYSPQQQAAAQNAAGSLGCRVQTPAISFRNPSDVMTGFSTLLGGDYFLGVKGFAQLADDGWQHVFPDNDALYAGWTFPSIGGSVSSIVSGEIVGAANTANDATFVCAEKVIVGDISSIVFRIQWTSAPPVAGAQQVNIEIDGIIEATETIPATAGGLQSVTWTGSMTGSHTYRVIAGIQGAGAGYAISGVRLTFGGTGTNAFTGSPGGIIKGDAFYQWAVVDGEDGVAELYPPTRGLRINSTAVAIPPPFTPNHSYVVEFSGIGSPVGIRFEDDNHADNENRNLAAVWCGSNCGT